VGELRAAAAAKRRGMMRLSLNELDALLQLIENGRAASGRDLKLAVRQIRAAHRRRRRVVERAQSALPGRTEEKTN
jgi:hypothetical protein